MCRGTYLIILGAWAFLGRVGGAVVWKHCFSMIFKVQIDAFRSLRGAIGSYFSSPGGPWAAILRVWRYPWANLACSCCQKSHLPFHTPLFFSDFGSKMGLWKPPNGVKIFDKLVQNASKRSLRFWIAFSLDFGWFSGVNLIRTETHGHIKTKRPKATFSCIY